MMSWKQFRRMLSAGLLLLLLAGGAASLDAVTLEFEQSTYTVRPGDTFDITVRFSEPVSNGLEGYALKLSFPAGLLAIKQIAVVPQLNFDLFEPGAERDAGPGFASIAGFTQFGQPAYSGTDFVTFTVTLAKAAQQGQVTLDLAPLLANAVNFVDGLGNALDGTLLFGTATLDILPPWPNEFVDDLRVNLEGDQAVLRFSGIPGRSYRILYSSSLNERSWIVLEDVVAPQDGQVEVTDSVPTGPRFYRITSP